METITNIITSIGQGIYDFFHSIIVFLYSLRFIPQFIAEMLSVLFGSNEHFFAWLFAKVIELVVLAYFTLMSVLTPFVWDVASVIVQDIYTAAGIQQYASAVPAPINALLSTLGVYRAIDILLTAYVTRWVYKFIPFVGR